MQTLLKNNSEVLQESMRIFLKCPQISSYTNAYLFVRNDYESGTIAFIKNFLKTTITTIMR